MGKENDAMLSYLEDNEKFADLFNLVYFGGKQVVKAQELEEASEVYPGGQKGKDVPRIRDIKRRLRSGRELKILAVEAQSEASYFMPWRLMDYDCREYGRQIRQIQRRNRAEEKERSQGTYEKGRDEAGGNPPGIEKSGNSTCSIYKNTGERLGEFKKSDRLSPVYTICLYHGAEKWDGPKSLKEMMDFGEASPEEQEAWKDYFADYSMRLVCANEPMDYSCLRTPLRELFRLLPHRRDKEQLRRTLQENAAYQNLDVETARAVSVLMGVKAFMEKEERYKNGEGYNMCQALQEMMEDSRREGEMRGEMRGLKLGEEQGLKLGEKRGEEKMAQLTKALLQQKRYDDLEHASEDAEYREVLVRELSITVKEENK